jgi:hypothetical protein
MPGNIPRSDLQTPLGRTWNAESRRDLDARLLGNPESRYHSRQFGVHPGNPGFRRAGQTRSYHSIRVRVQLNPLPKGRRRDRAFCRAFLRVPNL